MAQDSGGNTIDNGSHPAALGVLAHDTTTLGGKVDSFSLDGTGAVTYVLYSNDSCAPGASNQYVLSSENVNVSSDAAANSSATSALAAGSYSYQATYNGTANYTSKTGGCEPFTVQQATPTVSTVAQDSGGNTIDNGSHPAALGVLAHDTTTLGGKVDSFSLDGTGAVTYVLYSNDSCAPGASNQYVLSSENVNVSSDAAANSSATSALAAGSYSYQATYNGTANYTSKTGGCEPFTVQQATPTVSTVAQDSGGNTIDNGSHPAALGVLAHDTTTLGGKVDSFSLDGTGAVTYVLYSNDSCAPGASNQYVLSSENVNVSSDAAANSSATSALAAGSYSYQATYNGTANYTSKTGGCEPFTVQQATPTVSTVAQDSGGNTIDNGSHPAALGVLAHDTTTLGGKVDSFSLDGTGAVTYVLYSNDSCAPGASNQYVLSSENVNVSSDAAANSSATSALAAGSYSYQATYNGTANYTSKTGGCEPFTVQQATPTVSTVAQDSGGNTIDNGSHPAALGVLAHDTTTLGGKVDSFSLDGTGAVTYVLYSNDSCAPGASNQYVLSSENVNVSSDAAANSSATSALAAGSYSYQATYNGTANYTSKTGGCEPFTVQQATPTVSTVAQDSGGNTIDNGSHPAALGVLAHDTTTLGGKVDSFSLDGTGAVTYVLYSNDSCAPGASNQYVLSSENVNVSSDAAANSSATSALAAGSYSYQATYNGTANYTSKTGGCEPFTVQQATPTVSTVAQDSGGNTIDNGSHPAALGVLAHDTTTLGGKVDSFSLDGTGAVTYVLYSNDSCAPGASNQYVLSSENVNVSSDAAANSSATSALAAGSYSYQATYNGTANYTSKTGGCEPFTVQQATPTVSTVAQDSGGNTIDNGSHPAALGVLAHDTTTLGGKVDSFSLDGTGAVTYVLYSNDSCAPGASNQYVLSSENVNVSSDAAANSSATSALAAGSYSYQATYNGTANYTSKTGGCEPFTVQQATPTVTTVVKDGASPANPVTDGSPATYGTPTHDTASLSSLVSGFSADSTATLTYSFYTTHDCSGSAASTQSVTVASDNSVPDSTAQTLGAGTYSYQATYNGNANYTTATATCEKFTVQKAVLTVTGPSPTVTYGDLVPSLALSLSNYSGFKGTDSPLSLTTQPTCSTTYVQGSPVNGATGYPVTCSGGAATNYTFSYVPGKVTVNQKQLTVTAPSPTVTYGQPVPSLALTASNYSGFYGSDSPSSLTTQPTCSTTYVQGSTVAGSPYPVTCSGGVATNYIFKYVAGTITVVPQQAPVAYIGQTTFVTSGSSSTTAQVALSASLQDTTGGGNVGTATLTFTDLLSGKVLASGVKVTPVSNTNVAQGTANKIVTLSTGQYGAAQYLIQVSVDNGNYQNCQQTGQFTPPGGTQQCAGWTVSPSSTQYAAAHPTVTVMIPPTQYSIQGAATIPILSPSTAAGTYGDATAASYTVGMQYNKSGTNPKGQIQLVLERSDGTYYITSNSITSVAFAKASGTQPSKDVTIYTKASIYKISTSGVETGIDGGVTLRVDAHEGCTTSPTCSSSSGDTIGFTVLSSKDGSLYYSNNWVYSAAVGGWATVEEAVSPYTAVVIN